MNREWLQALFDLMANKRIELNVSGEFHEVDAELRVESWESGCRKLETVAEVIGAEDFESAMAELMEKARQRV